MSKLKNNKGVSLIESLVCLVIIGIGFIAVLQLSAFSIGSMDRATEKNKLNYLSGKHKLKEIENCEVIDLSNSEKKLVKIKDIY